MMLIGRGHARAYYVIEPPFFFDSFLVCAEVKGGAIQVVFSGPTTESRCSAAGAGAALCCAMCVGRWVDGIKLNKFYSVEPRRPRTLTRPHGMQ